MMLPDAQQQIKRRPILMGKVNFPITLAPMVGLTHAALRSVVRDYLPQNAVTIWPTEMLNSKRLPFEEFAKTPETLKYPGESELVPQILGNEEKSIAASVEKLIAWGAEGIDINMGCPVQKALRHNYGVALAGDPKYAAEVVRMTVKNSNVPVSVKIRSGQKGETVLLGEFAQRLVDAGAAWLTLHPRTPEQKRRGSADWRQIAELRKMVAVPVIGNGDIQIAKDVLLMREQTSCDAVMVGRALAARPWLLWQVGELLGFQAPSENESFSLGVLDPQTGKRRAPQSSSEEGGEYGRCLVRLLQRSRELFGEDLALRKVRFYIRMTSVWLEFGHTLISISTKSKSLAELEERAGVFFEGVVHMNQKTDLRE